MVEAITNGLIEVFATILPDLIKCTGIATKITESKNKERKQELRKACKINNEDHEVYVSDRLYADIKRMSKGSVLMEVAFTSVAVRSSKLFLYTIYYLTDPDAKLLSFDEDDCKFINTISEMAGAGRIYKNVGVLDDITKYDSKFADVTYSEGFLISLDDVMEKVADEEIRKKIITKLGMGLISNTGVPWLGGTVSGINARVDEDGMIHPIFFTDEPMVNTMARCQSEDITPDRLVIFESQLADFFNPEDYYFYSTNSDGAYILNIARGDAMGAVDSYIIDDGSIMGGENVSVLANFVLPDGRQDSIFVNVKRNPEIAQVVLHNRFYLLNQFEVMKVVKGNFNDTVIYHNIDFSNTFWYDSLNADQLSILERRLSKILPHIQDARLRFSTFSSIDSFTLCSDDKVKSQMKSGDVTSSKILEGMTIIVTGNTADIYYAGKCNKINLE